jgi:hypothetical protein
MPTTTNYGWTTPADTDLVKDGAAAIRTLGSSIDTTLKTQIDAQIPDSLLTTTGDTIYASGASTPARLGIGSTGQVLTVAGGVPTWATAAAGDKSKIWMKDSTYYIKNFATGTSQAAGVLQTTYYIPIYLPNYALDRISIRNSSNPCNITYRLGIYNADLTTGRPSTVYLDAGTVVVTTANTNFEITISTTPPAGYYFLAVNAQTVTSGSIEIVTQTGTILGNYGQTSSSLTGALQQRYQQTGVTGAFATAGTLTPSSNDPFLVGLRIA